MEDSSRLNRWGALVLLGFWSASAGAQDKPLRHSGLEAMKAEAEVVHLAPTADSDPSLLAPSVYRTKGGDLMFGGAITIPIPDEPFSISMTISYVLDIKKQTYEVKLLHGELPAGRGTNTPAPDAGGDYRTCTSTAVVKEYDPIWIELVRTATTLSWLRGPNHPACADFSSGQCSPFCPTAFGTCWAMNPSYLPPCSRVPVQIGSMAPFETSTVGHYVNFDFLNPNLPTFVEQYDTIRFQNGSATVYWDAIESGEASSNLFATVTTTAACD